MGCQGCRVKDTKGTLARVEAAYWRALRKNVRAENIMSGARETFVDKLKRSYFGRNGSPKIASPGAGVAADMSGVVLSDRPRAPAASIDSKAKAKPRLPIPFFGLERQVYGGPEVIFTCVVGDRHFLQEPLPTAGYEHVLYVDRDLPIAGWAQRPLLFWDASPKIITLFHKYALSNLVPDGTKMIWVDSRVDVAGSVARTIFDSLEDSHLCLFKHYERHCVYDEILAVLAAKRSTSSECEEYARHLRTHNFPRNQGLYETGVMGFRVGPEVRALFRRVFGLCYRYAPRDQLALPVALAQSRVRVHLYNNGETNLRNSPSILVKSWKDAGQ